ncbi:thiamine pyrophosphate-dependent enzyme [Nocardioides sp. AE5]|uniref:thiamine pyrophosphate-dependent enzyme n=1 Tax=Nocardioides sp. AE5 TaxID=2962573 RepID=UPI00288187BE|nr:thiamine pyrophosphate-dependent enzyme [Nocardioides sp. AE5]MDT0202480.1 thiamine pyrophosphate-dependent enzyme [Nocardioides sp. AE5]
MDLEGWLGEAGVTDRSNRRILSVSLDTYRHNGWSKDHQAWPRSTTLLIGDPDRTAIQLAAKARQSGPKEFRPTAGSAVHDRRKVSDEPIGFAGNASTAMSVDKLGAIVRTVFKDISTTFVRFPIGWHGGAVDFDHPMDFLGSDGGAGVGSGPGLAVGAALALRDSDRLPVAILGDGDFLMGCTALWSACQQGLGLLVVVSNNRSYFNDELHQERTARVRGRPVENRWVGQRLDDPPVDIAGLARAQGAQAFGPLSEPLQVEKALLDAIALVRQRHVVVLDVLVAAGYNAAAAATVE